RRPGVTGTPSLTSARVRDLARVLAREQRAVEEDLPDELGLLRLRHHLLGEARPHVAAGGQHESLRQRRALLDGPNRGPERALHRLALLGHEALEREGVTDVAAEVLEHARLRLGEDAVADRTDELGGATLLLALELRDEGVGRRRLTGRRPGEPDEEPGQL